MEIEELRKLADSFFEWPTEDRAHVTLTSALLFAQHVLRMSQQPPAPIPTAWQPIESAPEGVHVLVHYAKHITDLDPKWEWESDAQRTFVAMRNADYWVQDVGIGQSGIVEPTHWQPLPPAPGGSDD